jgi:hypothetical protein
VSRFLLYSSFLLLLSACRSTDSLPIPEAKLIEILADAHIAEAAVQSLGGAQRDSLITAYYNQLFEIHQVSRQDFEASLEALEQNPARMMEVYEKVTEHLNRLELESRGG